MSPEITLKSDKEIKSCGKELKEIYKALLDAYGYQGWWPLFNEETGKIEYHLSNYKLPKNYTQIFEIYLGSVLTQNTSWKNAAKSIENLRKNNFFDKDKLHSLDTKKLADLIKSSGYNNQKSRKIKELINFLNSNKAINRENLLSVWGIGRETADSILLYAYKEPFFVIDNYTKRIFSRLGLFNDNLSYDAMQEIFHENLNHDYKMFNEYHALLVEHGKKFCKKIPLCKSCPLKKHCNYHRNLY